MIDRSRHEIYPLLHHAAWHQGPLQALLHVAKPPQHALAVMHTVRKAKQHLQPCATFTNSRPLSFVFLITIAESLGIYFDQVWLLRSTSCLHVAGQHKM